VSSRGRGLVGPRREPRSPPVSAARPGKPRFPVVLRLRLTPKQLLLLRNHPPLRPSECCIWILATTTKICCPGQSTPRQRDASTRPRVPALLVHVQESPVQLNEVFVHGACTPTDTDYDARPGMAERRCIPSIFRATPFGWWAITHSLADAGFHGHCPAVVMGQHLSTDSKRGFGSLTGHKFEPFLPSLLTNVAH